jgi:small subunit ribosomal protein S1
MLTDSTPDKDSKNLNSQTHMELDEGYWSALLNEGEHSANVNEQSSNGNGWDHAIRNHPVSQDYEVGEGSDVQDWRIAQETCNCDASVNLVVRGYNQGGLLVSWNSLRGFVPASQLINFPVDVDEYSRRSLLAKYVGKMLDLRIIEIDASADRLILSERAANTEPGQRAEVLTTLEAGTVVEGEVTNLCDFGAFVDLGGIEGLIHISELSWGRVNHPRDVLKSGQQVKVHIMSVDTDEGRVALSLKRMQPDPWASVENRYEVGQVVEGVITNVVDFGAFACIEEGLEGLVHISELAEGQFLHPRNVVNEGDRVKARILNIDGSARRLGLSLRENIDNGSSSH